jgi:hypothetical protein
MRLDFASAGHISLCVNVQEQEEVATHLELRREGSIHRHYLSGRLVRVGDELELLLSGGRWLRGRYEWSGNVVVWPAFRIALEGKVSTTSDRRLTGALPLPPNARLRWAGR